MAVSHQRLIWKTATLFRVVCVVGSPPWERGGGVAGKGFLMPPLVNVQSRLSRLEKQLQSNGSELLALQKWRLGAGLLVFGLLVVSQIIPGFYLERLALFGVLPLFIHFLQRSRQHQAFQGKLQALKGFYEGQARFQRGEFPLSTKRPETMACPPLARDLDLHILFEHLDHGFSKQGQKQLDQWLSQNFSKSQRKERQKGIAALAQRPGLIRRLQLKSLAPLVDYDRIQKEMERPFLNPSSPWSWVIPVVWVLGLASMVLAFPKGIREIGFFIYLATMLLFIIQNQSLFSRLQGLEQDLIGLGERIPLLERLAQPMDSTPFLKNQTISRDVKKLGRLVSLMSLRANPFFFYLLHLFIPWDFLITHISERQRQKFSEHLKKWTPEALSIEVLSQFSNLLIYHPTQWAQEQEPGQKPFLSTRGLSHPLLDQNRLVTNDLNSQESQLILITGSNMSGKSTFLRALGLNACLANIGAPVFAKHFSFQPMPLMTCIRVSDSLRDGQSYFYAEVQRLKSILEKAQGHEGVLFLIDEPLRGTNNKERLMGNESYLKQILKTKACGFVSTHDLELTKLAQDSPLITNTHFSEQWENQDLRFDYKIKQGPSKSTNALKILAREGLYPAFLANFGPKPLKRTPSGLFSKKTNST